MTLNSPEKPKKGWSCLMRAVAVLVAGLVVLWIDAGFSVGVSKISTMRASSNARQIYGHLLTYAADHNGLFPEGPTANAAFRELFKTGLVRDEWAFGCERSCFIPDGRVGTAPDYTQALEPGENHWMLVKGQDSSSSSTHPLLLENAAGLQPVPHWRLPDSGFYLFLSRYFSLEISPGRTWRNGEILAVQADGAVVNVKLVKKDGRLYLPDSLTTGKYHPPVPALELLDVERKPEMK